jgi:cyclase|tara:strand:- start:2722 stop:3462 length:741 start_codon:yes stop_codon:yes gene_type:complete
MRKIRLIARLDIKNSNLIKSINLEGLRIVGDPNTFAKKYYQDGIDELVFMDCVATLYGRNNLYNIINTATKDIFIPITVGGGVRSLEDARNILNCGADKIAVNTAAVIKPEFISELANVLGSQSVVLSVEAKKRNENHWEVYTNNGRELTGWDVFEWIKRAVSLGVGEILLTSIDKEGTRKGFDIELIRLASQITEVPIIASGGLGKVNDLIDVINIGKADAAAVADAIHYKRISVKELKNTIMKF